jgi:hypothetical protein
MPFLRNALLQAAGAHDQADDGARDDAVRLGPSGRGAVSPPAFASGTAYSSCSAALIGRLRGRLGAFGLLCGGGLTLLLPLSVLR